MSASKEVSEQHTLAILADNEPGVMARVIGLFSGRGYNIDSLTVSEVIQEKHLSRFTIVTTGSPMVIEQIRSQLERLVPVQGVTDMTVEGNPIARELALVKVAGVEPWSMESTGGAGVPVVGISQASVSPSAMSNSRLMTSRSRNVSR